jgi:hypothetical protein
LYAPLLSDTEASSANTSPSLDTWRSAMSSARTTVVEKGVSSCERAPSAPLLTFAFRCCGVPSGVSAVTVTAGKALASLGCAA